jgi:DNA helicase-2/ATP-dependent DNA helicase PcrA
MERDLAQKKEVIIPTNLKKVSQVRPKMNLFDGDIITGNIVEHNRFGTGTVLGVEGKGPDKKAEIQFATAGKKKLLLQFAKLKVIG